MIDPITRRSKILEYDNKRTIPIVNLVKTMLLTRHPCEIRITHDKGLEFIGNEVKKSLIEEEYGIIDKPTSLVNLNYIETS